jgi:outer membrane protein OmpA-like peptidoglycan-associated protein
MIKKIALLVVLFTTFLVRGQEEKYTIKNIDINNAYSNFGTTFFGDGKVVYASPVKKSYIIRNVWKGNNQPFLDLYLGDIAEDGELINVKKFSENINTRYHEADVAFTKDKKTVYFSRNNYLNKKYTTDTTGVNLIQLYRAQINDLGEWVNVEPMPFNNDNYQTGHPALSADEKTLYFISDMPGGFGRTDVYKAQIFDDGSIGEPVNLGPEINTPQREMFASISGNDELYFSSDGREDGLGGLDIYVTKLTENNISTPQNLGKPINSSHDDFSFIINYETRRGYFSSNRNGGKGDDDIYTFVQEIPLEFACNQLLTGTVTEKYSGNLLPGSLVILQDESGNEIDRKIADENAFFSFEVPCNNSFTVIGTKENYSTDTKEIFSTEGVELKVPLVLETEAFVTERGKCLIKINPIYFDFDKSYIRPDAAIELNKVVEVMRKYPDLIIEGGSHTDSRGTFKYNEALSTRRANSTVQYIIEQGISPDRISAKGYGETQLVNGCADGVNCSEKEHQFNRRTEFVIVNYEEIKHKYPEICPPSAVTTQEQIEDDFDIIVDPKVTEQRKIEAFNSQFEVKGDKVLIKLNPIYFDLNSSFLRDDALPELYKVIQIMDKYPNLIVECGSHTDARATSKYNNWLSDRRAKRTVDYIISKGINPNRISGKGYGETQLTNRCADGVKCSEYEHQQNRRIEFVVLNPEVLYLKE